MSQPQSADRRTKVERNAAIMQRLADGKTIAEVAKEFGVTEPRIYQIRKAAREAAAQRAITA